MQRATMGMAFFCDRDFLGGEGREGRATKTRAAGGIGFVVYGEVDSQVSGRRGIQSVSKMGKTTSHIAVALLS
jgi:hypothetical protein